MPDRWGFEEADDWEPVIPEPEREADVLVGTDADDLAAVTVTPTADVVSVRLGGAWRQSRGLSAAVVTAANAATMRAVAWQVEHPPTERALAGTPDETPITAAEALRLIDAVSADVATFTQRVAEIIDRPVVAESAGGHVRASARAGQVVDLAVDPGWTAGARVSEVESELLDALRALRTRCAPGELANGPESEAITTLTALLADPNAMLRRVGLLP
jgi:hypothetical protein